MVFEKGTTISIAAITSFARNVITVNNFVMVVAGVLAGYSLAVLGKETVIIPIAGSVPGILVGAIGLIVAFTVYQQGSCCDDCGGKECGCIGECGDSCSYGPR